MKMPKYPLEQLMLIKKRRLEEAEKKLKATKEQLKKEIEKLKSLEEEAQTVHDHKMDKLKQLDEKMLKGTTSDKIEIAEHYLEVVEEDLKKKKRKVKDQEKQVKIAEENVEIARKDMLKKQQDVEKLKIHEGDWTKEVKKEMRYQEAIEGDEIGSIKNLSLKREKQDREEYEKRKKREQS
ncbi:type III secretion T3S chaperone [Candidatus Aerophobetes bacterium]|uniref:Type III secretion T3S chaperone n=1 Tax=Aerophobetes bacterium TaxID=2030807 RepID=A0A2A4YLT1_UNCAE|nr:MAG: type III secretion T3S chaperone [Candidatus Aerophobetes bacterium]